MTGSAFQPAHDLARLQQAFDEEAASLRVKSLLVHRFHIVSPPAEPASQVMAQLRRETTSLALALAVMAVAFIGIYVALPA